MSDCGVCIGFSGEPADDFQQKFVVAESPVECSECGDLVNAGDKYEHVDMSFDGGDHEYDTCMVCYEIREAFCCDGVMYGGMFWGEMEDYAFENLNESCFLRLKTAAAKKKLQDYWIAWKFA